MKKKTKAIQARDKRSEGRKKASRKGKHETPKQRVKLHGFNRGDGRKHKESV